jgi:hypothetical protein
MQGDYNSCNRVRELCRTRAFCSPGLKGWSLAVQALVNPREAAGFFADASDAFAKDIPPSHEELMRRGTWSATNIELWAPYFRARSIIARVPSDPSGVKALIAEAVASLAGTEMWEASQVTRFRVLLRSLQDLLIDNIVPNADSAKSELNMHCAFFGEEPEDTVLLQFINAAAEALDEFRRAPSLAVTSGRLHVALELLRRSSVIDAAVTDAIAPEIGERALAQAWRPVQTWIHRTLGEITQEKQLRHIILRLAQASIPKYAQVLHGPLEYGKDIVVALNSVDGLLLRMYQAKCGDINTEKWNESSDELEKMFLVPLSDFQIGTPIDRREGILVTNGHATPYVQPVMEGWFAEQKRDHRRDVQFMHLDRLVEWVLKEGLVYELKAAFSELKIPVSTGGPI